MVNFVNFAFDTDLDQDEKIDIVTNRELINEITFNQIYSDILMKQRYSELRQRRTEEI